MRIVLTHSEGRFEGLAEALAKRGHEVTHRPLIVTRPRRSEDVAAEARALLALPWLLFTSRSAVEAFVGLGLGWRSPEGAAPLVGAVGIKTASALRRAGVEPALVAERSPRAEGLARVFLSDPRAAGPVGLPQGDRALPTLRRALEEAGLEVRPLVLYETVAQPLEGGGGARSVPAEAAADAGRSASAEGSADAELVVLASPSAAQALPDAVAERATLVAIGPTTAGALAERGLGCRQATAPSVAGVLAEVEAVVAQAEAAAPAAGVAGHGGEGGRA